jgi:hypothetical protein
MTLISDEGKPASPVDGWGDIVKNSVVYVNISDARQCVIFNSETGVLYKNLDISILNHVFPLKNDLIAFKQERVTLAKFVYDPHTNNIVQTRPNGEIWVNLYDPPAWKKDHYFFNKPLPPRQSKPSDLFIRYLNHLCDGDAASISYVIDWLHVALTSRNYTILTAIGEEGIGKGVLGKIMESLVGVGNFSRVRDSVFKERFNAPLKDKQIVYVDEVCIKTVEEANRIKDVVNDKVEIERKGVDAELKDNYASFYLSSNEMDAVKISGSDRRFSIVQLTDKSLLTSFTTEEIRELISDKEVAHLASYLLGHTVTNDMMRPFKSARYEEVKEAGLAEWELWLLDEWYPSKLVGDEVEITTVKEQIAINFPYMKQSPGRERLKKFIAKYPNKFRFYQKFPSGKRYVKIL